jgi:ATP/maltotriose-dependent transcriptional regulator MalT
MVEIDTPFVVVVDNYEVLGGTFGIRTFIHRLLEILPFNCHLMFGSRVLPDVPVTRLVAKRQLAGLTARDLRFTSHEIRDLLQMSGIQISENQAQIIATSSEGWVTGILLLADLLRKEAPNALFDIGRATTQTYDYLAEEVLNLQPPDIQHFLYTSAVLREMSSRLCREALQIQAPGPLLAEVERRNLFVTRFGRGSTATYRYHNLFRDFLDKQLCQRDLDHYAKLHRRAAKWFERNNDTEEAVYHYLAAENYQEATTLMERVAREWFTRGRVETILYWAEELPKEAKTLAPRLSLYQSKVLTDRYDYKEAREALAHAEAGFAARKDTARLARVHDQRAVLALFEGRYEDTIKEARAALDMLGPEEILERAGAQRLIGKAYVGLGRFREGISQLQDALTLFRQVGSPYDVINLLQDLGTILVDLGCSDEAEAYVSEALAVGRRLGAPTPLAAVLNNLGWLHYARGEYRRSLSLYEEGLAAARRGGDLRFQAYISVGMADLYRDIGIYERAEPMYNAGWQLAQGSEPGLAVYILAARADMYRWQGDYARAVDLLERAHLLAEERGLELEGHGLLPMTKGITLAEDSEPESGIRLLSEAICFLKQRGAKRELARAHFLRGRAYFSHGDKHQAAIELRKAMGLAGEIGTKQFAIVEGQHAEDLLQFGITEGMKALQDVIEGVKQLRVFRSQQMQGDVTEEEDDVVGRLKIYALGEGQVVREDHTISSSEWKVAMAKEMFFYILLHGPLDRDAIGLVFWPDLPSKKITDRFHTTLYRMRGAVGSDAVIIEEGKYRLGDIDYWFDVEEFEELVGRARLLPPQDWQTETLWRHAVELYRGDFLADIDGVWCVPKRETLREMYIEALVGIGECHEARREFEGAIEWYRRALEVDELREDIHRRIMCCYDKTGRRSEALAQYHRVREILRQELNVEPSIETKRLYEHIAGKRPD